MAENSNSIERTLSIMETVAHSANGMTNSEISRQVEIPKSSASYILRVLEKRGYLVREKETGRYHLGLKLVSLTRESLTHINVRDVARPIMKDFVEKTHLSVHLAVIDNGRAVYVEKIEAPSFVKMDIWVGHRLPVHTTAIGKALTANLSEKEIIDILNLRGMEKNTAKTITNQAKFLKELKKIKELGFAIDNEENSAGVRCVAAPVFDSQGKTVAAIGTSDTIISLNDEKLPKVVKLIKKSAADISHLIGYGEK